MVSAENGNEKEGKVAGLGDGPISIPQRPLHVSTVLASDDQQPNNEDTSSFLRSSLGSPTQKFWQLAFKKEEISRVVLSSVDSNHIRDQLRSLFPQKINWNTIQHLTKQWFSNPMNIALFIWIVCVTVSGAILFLVMTGMLNKSLPKKSERNTWFEVNNQILNALFTLMCLYQHPKRFHHLAMLIKWSPEDISRLRKIYCKNGTYKPHEWAHMMVVVILLHINCFATYALCGLNLGYRRPQRPPIGVALCLCVAIAAPAAAGLYTIVSPLGKEYEPESDDEEEASGTPLRRDRRTRLRSRESRLSFASADGGSIQNLETNPSWRGGILSLWDDISLAYLSLFCSFCVFGWNMERLGFGNMYVHIATFILFCTAPYWIFNLAALNIDNEAVRQGLGLTGMVLCIFGLLYGGYWRMRMRMKFNLPSYTFCCGKPAVSDLTLWMFCCWCSLAQEVRTADTYDIVDGKFYQKTNGADVELERPPRFSVSDYGSGPSSPVVVISTTTTVKGDSSSGRDSAALKGHEKWVNLIASVEEESSGGRGMDNKCMVAPPPVFWINRDGN